MRKTIALALITLAAFSGMGADIKITALPSTNAAVKADLIPIVTNIGGTPVTRHVSVSNLVSTAGGGVYVLAGCADGANPADATTYYVGAQFPRGNVSNWDEAYIEVPKAGTIKRFHLKVLINSTLGTAEDVLHYIQVNDTTDTLIATLDYDTARQNNHNTSVSLAVSAGDRIALKIVTPTWATNPLVVHYFWQAY